MIFNVYSSRDAALVITPKAAPSPFPSHEAGSLQHMGYAEVAFCQLSDELASAIASRGYGDVGAPDESQVRASMWGMPRH